MSGIYLRDGEMYVSMSETPFDAERVLQALIAQHPEVLADEPGGRGPLLLVRREAAVMDQEDAAGRWSLDHLYVDSEGVPTLVEVKRSSDTRGRREVVAQMLDYAANAKVSFSAERMAAWIEEAAQERDTTAAELLADTLGVEDPDAFWATVATNLDAERFRLIFVSDVIPPELRRIIVFLNGQMANTEVLAIEVKQYVDDKKDHQTIVPRVIGNTEAARQTKGAGSPRPRRKWTEGELLNAIREKNEPEIADRMIDLYEWMKDEGAQATLGKGVTGPSISLWLGKDADSRPVAVVIFPDSITIPFVDLKKHRAQAELERLAALARELPGVAPYLEDLEGQNFRRSSYMRPEDVLGSADALVAWKRVLLEATRAT